MLRWLVPLLLLLGPSTSSAVPCLPGTLQDYINLGATGCEIGAVTFASFTVEPGQSFATPIAPGEVQVIPSGSPSAPTLVLGYEHAASAGELLESFFRFQASASVALIEDFIGIGSASASGDGVVTAAQDVCPDGSFGAIPTGCPNPALTLIGVVTESLSFPSESQGLPSATFLDLFVDVVIDGGLEGSASLGSVTLRLVPEPASVLLLALGLAPLALSRARRAS
jgi:hypothetical protein